MLAAAYGVSKIIIACGKTDLRCGIDGLTRIIGSKYNLNFRLRRTSCFSSAVTDLTESKVFSGKEMDFSFYTNGLKMDRFHGRRLLMMLQSFS